jgi:cytochrome c oxidase subunit IV
MSEKSKHSGEHSGHGEHHEGFGHVAPASMLLVVGGVLLFLTAVTVWVTMADLGRSGNLIVAMGIATVKAVLVCTYFMHLKWDKPFNAVVFGSSVLFVGLFIIVALLDKADYEPDIQEMHLLEGR